MGKAVWRWAAIGSAALFLWWTGALVASATSASPPLGSKLEARAAMFVLERFLNEKIDLKQIKPLYGESVFYFRKGVQTRAQVLADKRDYLQRWPKRSWKPDLRTLRTRVVAAADGRRDVQVQVEVDFEVSGPRRRGRDRWDGVGESGLDARERAYGGTRTRRISRGRSIVAITVAERGGDFIILSEGGRVISRR